MIPKIAQGHWNWHISIAATHHSVTVGNKKTVHLSLLSRHLDSVPVLINNNSLAITSAVRDALYNSRYRRACALICSVAVHVHTVHAVTWKSSWSWDAFNGSNVVGTGEWFGRHTHIVAIGVDWLWVQTDDKEGQKRQLRCKQVASVTVTV